MVVQSIKNDLISSASERKKRYNNNNGNSPSGFSNGDGSTFGASSSNILSPNYDPLIDIFEIFDSPSALVDINQLLKYSNSYESKLEETIDKKREEYKKILIEFGSDQGIEEMDAEVLKLLDSFQNMKGLAEITGNTINSMTANIKALDHSKKNLTFTMTTLKRLQMLVTAYDRLEKQLEKQKQVKNYSDIKQLLSAVLELNEYFQDFKSIDEINRLNRLITTMKNQIVTDIFNDFELEFNEELSNDTLIDACYILQTLGTAYKEQLETWYINATLKEVTQIFTSSEEAGSLDNLNRRFIYFQNVLTNFETKHLQIFPKSWGMSLKVTEKFCLYTKNDLKEVLNKETRLKTGTDVNILLNSLSQTLDFELFLNKKFKYYKDFEEQLQDSESPNFSKSISDVFEPYLNIWIDHQESTIENKLVEFTNPTKMFQKTGEGIPNDNEKNNGTSSLKKPDESVNVLESAAELFRIYRQILSQLSKLTTGKALIRLSKIFSKYLIQYQHKVLDSMLPDSKTLISADLKDQQEGTDIICLVLNTADYCSQTVFQLEEKIKSLIKPVELSSQVEFENPNTGFLQLISYCINLLFYKIENDIQISWKELSNFNWKILNEVTGESRYLESLRSIIREDCQLIFKKLSKVVYIRNLIDKLVEMLLKNILLNIIKLEPISVVMAEQFKLDLQELKTFINILPTLTEGGDKILSSNSFKTSINIKFKNIDNLLKILMVPNKPMDTFINSYFSIIGDSNFANFMKVLQLKGVLKLDALEKDKFKYMDMFKLQLGSFEENNTDENSQLIESNEYLEKINVANTTTTIKKTHGHTKTNSKSIYLPVTVSSNATSNNSSFAGFMDSNSNTTSPVPPEPPLPILPDSSNTSMDGNETPKGNFGFFSSPKIDTHSLLNTKDNFEKNIAKTFSDNKTTFNENFRKFFKRGE